MKVPVPSAVPVPRKVLFLPVIQEESAVFPARLPTPVLASPVVTEDRAPFPSATLQQLLLDSSASNPLAVLPLPVMLL